MKGIVNGNFKELREFPYTYDDWRWGGTGVNPPGAANGATLTEITTGQWNWLFVNDKAMVFHDLQIPHDYKEGTEIVPHIHFATTTSETYTGTWTMIITSWLAPNAGSPRQAQQTVTAAFGTAYVAHQMQSIDFSANMTGTDRKISSCCSLYLSLALSAGTGLYLLGLDGHYQKDAIGSKLISAKD